MDHIFINYISTSYYNNQGIETVVCYAIRIQNDFKSVLVEEKSTFDELKEIVNLQSLKEYLRIYNCETFKMLLENGGLYFNNKWYSLLELEQYSLMNIVLHEGTI